MVDFSKRLGKKAPIKPLDPIQIYETLDRASDKGPLREIQREILTDWHNNRRAERDIIVKLHTGQGKTLIGLLMLQSKLNETGGPVAYLCPNNFLVNQTCSQAKQFGVSHCTAETDLPQDFLDGKCILVTSVQKLFNGLTKFGIGSQSLPVSVILIDDSHTCVDAIRDSFTIKLGQTEPAYQEVLSLFANALESQGAGTYADIKNQKGEAILLIPYWEWCDKQAEVVGILSKRSDKDEVKFAWPLIKNSLQDCQCVVSGDGLEIAPYLPPMDLFGSYYKAKHRYFMSATVTNDSFLVRGLRLSSETIRKPLVYPKERWSGEKMVLIPSLIDPSVDRSAIVNAFGKPAPRPFGVVVLTPSYYRSEDWKACGATIATRGTIEGEIEKLKNKTIGAPLVIVNRYDGIDLPDDMCRILIFDSLPHAESLIDRYAETCREESEVVAIRTARMIEQGLGRSVRGEKDYCVLILIGPGLVKTIRAKSTRKHLSDQTRAQIEIGLEIAEMAKEEMERGVPPLQAISNLARQCLKRDPAWKAYYVEKMDEIKPHSPASEGLDLFQRELEAEMRFSRNDPQGGVEILQRLVDEHDADWADKGWYLQEMARYTYPISKSDSNKLQISAHNRNRFLMRPRTGMQVDRIVVVSQKRIERILSWIKKFETREDMKLTLDDIVGRLEFGVKADRFEAALDSLGNALGFSCERPDKAWKEGPDNLWGVRDGEFLLMECKSEVHLKRAEIQKEETGQMNNACAWFAKHYSGAKAKKIMIIPTDKLGPGAGFNEDVEVMRKSELGKLTKNDQAFFAEFATVDRKDLSETKVQAVVNQHGLSVETLLSEYSRKVRP